MYTRYENCPFNSSDIAGKLLYSLPIDAFPLKYLEGKRDILIQIRYLSFSEVAAFLKTNPEDFAGELGKKPTFSKEYAVLRFKNPQDAKWGEIKCYFSCFSHPIVMPISLPGRMKQYYDIIFPLPEFFLTNIQEPCDITLRWKNYWGHS
jgi:hypothetical protein